MSLSVSDLFLAGQLPLAPREACVGGRLAVFLVLPTGMQGSGSKIAANGLSTTVVPLIVVCWLAVISFFLMLIAFYSWKLQQKNRKLEAVQAQQRELAKFRDDVFKIMGHDISGVLAGMSGILYLIKREEAEKAVHHGYVDQLVVLNEAAVEILGKLFVLGIDKTDLPQGDRPIYLSDDLSMVIKLAENLAQAKDISLLVQGSAGLVGLANLTYVEFILRSLLTNAIKFSYARGQVLLGMVRVADSIVFTVSNNGPGTGELDIQNVFAQGNRNSMGTNGERGLGVSLSLSKKISDKKNYLLAVANGAGGSISFSFQIPVG